MNDFIERLNQLPFAVYSGIQNTIFQTILLYIIIICLCYWLLQKSKPALFSTLLASLLFIAVESFQEIQREKQAKLMCIMFRSCRVLILLKEKNPSFTVILLLSLMGSLKIFIFSLAVPTQSRTHPTT
jgi:hypothetical protein